MGVLSKLGVWIFTTVIIFLRQVSKSGASIMWSSIFFILFYFLAKIWCQGFPPGFDFRDKNRRWDILKYGRLIKIEIERMSGFCFSAVPRKLRPRCCDGILAAESNDLDECLKQGPFGFITRTLLQTVGKTCCPVAVQVLVLDENMPLILYCIRISELLLVPNYVVIMLACPNTS